MTLEKEGNPNSTGPTVSVVISVLASDISTRMAKRSLASPEKFTYPNERLTYCIIQGCEAEERSVV